MPAPLPRFMHASTARYANYQRRINGASKTAANAAALNKLLNALLAQVGSNRTLGAMHRATLRTLAEKARANRKKAGNNQRRRRQRPNNAAQVIGW